MIVSDFEEDLPDDEPETKSDAVGLPLPQAQIASEMSKSRGENNEI